MDAEEIESVIHAVTVVSWFGCAMAIIAVCVALREISKSLKTLCARFNSGSFTQINMPPIADDDQGEFAAKVAAAMREARKG